MVSRGAVKKGGGTKASQASPKAGGGLGNAIVNTAVTALTGSGSRKTGSRKTRRHGPQYWANKVLVQKLKNKYYKMRYASVR